MGKRFTAAQINEKLTEKQNGRFKVRPKDATDAQLYTETVVVLRDILEEDYAALAQANGKQQKNAVCDLYQDFLQGR